MMMRPNPPDDKEWVDVKKNIEVNGDMVCPKCGEEMLPLWYTEDVQDPYSGRIKYKLYGYCNEHALFAKTWYTDMKDWP